LPDGLQGWPRKKNWGQRGKPGLPPPGVKNLLERDFNALEQAMQRLSGQYPRFGSRRIRVFLGREGIQVGQERCSRLWRQAGLQVPARRKRRKAIVQAMPASGR